MSSRSEFSGALNTCPACEFADAQPGVPILEDGELLCLSCGNRWKAFGDPMTTPRQSMTGLNRERAIDRPGIAEGKTPKTQKLKLSGAAFIIGLLLLASFSGISYEVWQRFEHREPATLQVLDVAFEELVRNNRGKVVRVSGLIANPGEESEAVPRLVITLRKSNGEELTRWHHRSSATLLKPGAQMQFVSSIHYDTPIIATAEAHFE